MSFLNTTTTTHYLYMQHRHNTPHNNRKWVRINLQMIMAKLNNKIVTTTSNIILT